MAQDSLQPGPQRCAALSRLALSGVASISTEHVPQGIRESEGVLPGHCRIAGEARPTRESRIGFELWLPDEWNGRYYQLGTGGFGGSIHRPSLAAELRRGNAVASTDTGHRGSPFDASWAQGRPERILDYGYRSIVQTAAAARALIEGYYGSPARRRYFVGCSAGGRQALIAAQRYAPDWDGIIAGAPPISWTRQLATHAWIQHALRADPRAWIPAERLPLIERTALASCTRDAVLRDGVPVDPRQCPLDAARLGCRASQTPGCLNALQVDALRVATRGALDVRSGARLHAGFEPTSAAVPGGWARWIVNADAREPSQLDFAEQYFRYFVLDDPAWTVQRFDPDIHFARAQARMVQGEPLARVLDASDTDLEPFAARGGKLLVYVGWADAVIAPREALAYYEAVAARMGGMGRVQRFFRLFAVPGMLHCQGGGQPSAFGQAGIVPGLRDDAEHDLRRALEAWVERDIAPEEILAVKFVDDDPARGPEARRWLCPHPALARATSAEPSRTSPERCTDPGERT